MIQSTETATDFSILTQNDHTTHLVSHSISVFFICLFGTSSRFRNLLFTPKKMQKSKIDLSPLIEVFWLSPSRTSYRKNKRFFIRLDYHTLSFFPLFGILVIHLPYVNGKHDGKITKFAVTKLKACKDWNHSELQSDVLWLVDIFYGIQLVTWTFLWWKRGNVICNFLVVTDISLFAYLFLNRKVLVSARVPALLDLAL